MSDGAVTFGPERVATDGEAKPDGADWNDPRYTMILSPCLSNAAQKCVQLGTTPPTTGSLYIDLTATFPISGMLFQGDRHQFQIDYYNSDAGSWENLWTVKAQESSSGLITRTTNLAGQSARYLAIYGTEGDDSNYSVSTVQVFTQNAGA